MSVYASPATSAEMRILADHYDKLIAKGVLPGDIRGQMWPTPHEP